MAEVYSTSWGPGEVYAGDRHLANYSNGTTYFPLTDWLGTERVRSDVNGNSAGTCTANPYGDNYSCSASGTTRIAYAGMEYDSESGLYHTRFRYYHARLGLWMTPDPAGLGAARTGNPQSLNRYAGKRYYGNSFSRFMTPDPLLNSGQPWNPQSWNRYAYVENNPLRYTDPTGLYKFGKCSGTTGQCDEWQQRFRDSIDKAKESLKGLDPNSKEAKALKKAIEKLGDEGKGNIKVNFGDAGNSKEGPNLGKTVGNSITINYKAVDSEARDAELNDSQKAALDAGLSMHEGTHAGGGPSVLGFLGMHGEHAAYYTESVTYQGLHNTDKAFGLWNESWVGPDKSQLSVEQHREAAIQNAIHPPKQPQQQESPK